MFFSNLISDQLSVIFYQLKVIFLFLFGITKSFESLSGSSSFMVFLDSERERETSIDHVVRATHLIYNRAQITSDIFSMLHNSFN